MIKIDLLTVEEGWCTAVFQWKMMINGVKIELYMRKEIETPNQSEQKMIKYKSE